MIKDEGRDMNSESIISGDSVCRPCSFCTYFFFEDLVYVRCGVLLCSYDRMPFDWTASVYVYM